ncbi:MAG: cold shock domain-containing protein [Methanobacteriota archaeon]
MIGIVTWYNVQKGYGFIKGEDGKRVFVHKSEVPFWNIFLNKGDKVEYEIQDSQKGIKATNMKILN